MPSLYLALCALCLSSLPYHVSGLLHGASSIECFPPTNGIGTLASEVGFPAFLSSRGVKQNQVALEDGSLKMTADVTEMVTVLEVPQSATLCTNVDGKAQLRGALMNHTSETSRTFWLTLQKRTEEMHKALSPLTC